MAEDAFARGR